MAPAESLQIELVWSPAAGDVQHRQMTVNAGCTVAQALQQCEELLPLLAQADGYKIGVWGRLQRLETVLRERDRIELYRPLTVDPKEARRQRYRAKGERIVSRHRPLAGKTTR
jgi:putative ubiquitin-RnfH superfamily antitoxin RatB of RatAB toxin-antitoxin module